MRTKDASKSNKMCSVSNSHSYHKTGVCSCRDIKQYINKSEIIDIYNESACVNTFISTFIEGLNQILDEKIWFEREDLV